MLDKSYSRVLERFNSYNFCKIYFFHQDSILNKVLNAELYYISGIEKNDRISSISNITMGLKLTDWWSEVRQPEVDLNILSDCIKKSKLMYWMTETIKKKLTVKYYHDYNVCDPTK